MIPVPHALTRRLLFLLPTLLWGAFCSAWSQEPSLPSDTATRTEDTASVVPPPSTIPAPFPGPQREDGTYGSLPLRHFFFPRPLEVWDRQWLLGVTLTIIPREVAEEELRQAPMLDGRLEFGLPLNFHLRGRLATNVLTTYGSIGLGWNIRIGRRLGLGLDMEAAYWYGFAKFEGFDITAQGALTVPTLSLGFALNEVLLSLQADAQIAVWRRTESNGIDVTQEGNALTAYGLGISVEQPLVGQRHIALGIGMRRARQTYQAWIAFSTFNEFLLYPEFSLHLLF